MSFVILSFLGLQIILQIAIGIACWLDLRAYKRLINRIDELEAELEADLSTNRQAVFLLGKVLAGRGYGRYKFDGETHTLEYGAIKDGACEVRFWSSDFSDKEHNNVQATE